MKIEKFLDTLLNARKNWEALLAKVDKSRMTEPGLPVGWSVKDVIAHVYWHEREMSGMLEGKALKGSAWWELPLDERNQLIYEEQRDIPLDEVLETAQKEYERFMKALQGLPQEGLNDPGYFEGMPVEWKPWQIIADNSHEHYQAHVPDIKEWLSIE